MLGDKVGIGHGLDSMSLEGFSSLNISVRFLGQALSAGRCGHLSHRALRWGISPLGALPCGRKCFKGSESDLEIRISSRIPQIKGSLHDSEDAGLKTGQKFS